MSSGKGIYGDKRGRSPSKKEKKKKNGKN